MTKQPGEHFKIRRVSAGNAWGVGPHADQEMTKQPGEHVKIRRVSAGGAWGWGPARTKK